MDAIPTGTLVTALVVSLLFLLFRSYLARLEARRDRQMWGMDDPKLGDMYAVLYLVLGLVGVVVSMLLLALKALGV